MTQDSFNEFSLNELVQKAKTMQNDMKLMQAKLVNAKVIGIAGNNDVQITMNGKYQVIATVITDHAYASKETLANNITIAVNDAIRKLEAITQK